MKKILAIVMMLCLLMTSFALAEEEVNWADVEPTLESYGLEGDFVTFDEIAVKIWIPSSMQQIELSDEDRDEGYIAYFLDDDETAQISVVYVDVDGMELTEYADMLPEYGAENIAIEVLNGMPAVTYTIPESDALSVAFATQMGYILELTMSPLSPEGAEIAWGIVGASIQPAE